MKFSKYSIAPEMKEEITRLRELNAKMVDVLKRLAIVTTFEEKCGCMGCTAIRIIRKIDTAKAKQEGGA